MSAPSRPVPPQRNLKGVLDVLGSGSVHLRSATNFVDVFSRNGMDLTANAEFVGGQWVPLDRTQPSALLQLLPGGTWTLYTAPATPSGAITFTQVWQVGQATTDANGWQVVYQADGKRRWRKRWAGIALTAVTTQVLVNAGALPSAVANLGAVDLVGLHSWQASGPQLMALGVVISASGASATTTLTVEVGTVDGSNVNAHSTSLDLFVELAER